jgi:hypothetical protein
VADTTFEPITGRAESGVIDLSLVSLHGQPVCPLLLAAAPVTHPVFRRPCRRLGRRTPLLDLP